MNQWKEEILSSSTQEFQKINETTYIQRRNFQKIEDSMGNEMYKCQSRFISKELYEDYVNNLNSPSQKDISEGLDTLAQAQVMSSEESLTIMSAIAELYETMILK